MARASGKVYKISDCQGYGWSTELRWREDDEFEGEKWPATEEAWVRSECAKTSREFSVIRGQINAGTDRQDRGKVRAKWLDKVRGI